MIPLHTISTLKTDGEREFISKLYTQYYSIMKKRAYEITYDYTVADDLINDAFIKFIEKIEVLSMLDGCKRTSYVVYTIRNISINYIKKRALENKTMFIGVSDDFIESISDVRASVEEISSTREESEELAKSLNQLSKRDRELLYYKYNLEMSDKEISEIMHIPINNIRQYLTRARRRALDIIKKQTEGYVKEESTNG